MLVLLWCHLEQLIEENSALTIRIIVLIFNKLHVSTSLSASAGRTVQRIGHRRMSHLPKDGTHQAWLPNEIFPKSNTRSKRGVAKWCRILICCPTLPRAPLAAATQIRLAKDTIFAKLERIYPQVEETMSKIQFFFCSFVLLPTYRIMPEIGWCMTVNEYSWELLYANMHKSFLHGSLHLLEVWTERGSCICIIQCNNIYAKC